MSRYDIDIDECTLSIDSCAPEATCTNTEGSFSCTCNQGYTGGGTSCTGWFLQLFASMSIIHISVVAKLTGTFHCVIFVRYVSLPLPS